METVEAEENHEKEPKLIGKITIIRHGHTTTYENHPDEVDQQKIALTPDGIAQVEGAAEWLIKSGRISSSEDVTLFATPKARTQDTLGILLNQIGVAPENIRVARRLRSIDVRKPEEDEAVWALHKKKKEAGQAEGKRFGWEEFWLTSDETDREDFALEPRDQVKRRATIALAATIKQLFLKPDSTKKIPHVIGSAHFETMNPLLLEVFPETPVEEIIVDNADIIELDVAATGNPQTVLVRVGFKDKKKVVTLNLKTRAIEPYEQSH